MKPTTTNQYMKSGANLIAEERARHTSQQLNYTPDHDAALADHELAALAVEKIEQSDPLGDPKVYGRALVVAGSLIAAEIDRLVRRHGGIAIPTSSPEEAAPAAETKESDVEEEEEEEVEVETAEDLVSNNNKDELLKLAEKEDVDNIGEHNTKAEIAAAIIAKREEANE